MYPQTFQPSVFAPQNVMANTYHVTVIRTEWKKSLHKLWPQMHNELAAACEDHKVLTNHGGQQSVKLYFQSSLIALASRLGAGLGSRPLCASYTEDGESRHDWFALL